jgi:hypothetical protein
MTVVVALFLCASQQEIYTISYQLWATMPRLHSDVEIATFVLICGLCASCNVVCIGLTFVLKLEKVSN